LSRQLILGLDIGTSSVRGALYDLNGNLLPKTLIKNERILNITAEGGVEIDADQAFHQVVAIIDGVLARSSGSLFEIIAVAACAFWHSLVGVDAKGKPTTKVLGWADNRSREYVNALRKKLDENEVHQRTGAHFHSSFWPAKLLWFRREQSKVFAKTAKWLSFSDYVALRLFDTAVTSVSMASATGMFDQRECRWDDKLAGYLRLRSAQLPQIIDDSKSLSLNRDFARRWPRLAGAKWFPAVGDGAANNIGAGCVTESWAALMVGTSGAMRVAYTGEPPDVLPTGLWSYRIDRGRVIIGGALSDGGGLYRWLQDNLRLDKNAEREITGRPPDSHGLTFLPFLASERSTGYHEFARGSIFGLTSHTDAIDIAQVAMESVAYRFAKVFEQLGRITKIKNIISSGGALRQSPVWTQIISNVLGRKISLVGAHEASMRGAVLLALESLGNIESIEKSAFEIGQIFEPDAAAHSIYKRARKRHQELYDLIFQNK
jgi:gluconokinase